MPELEDITYSDDEDDVCTEADFNNLETSIIVSPIPTTRVHKDHHVTQIIGDLSSATQTRKVKSAFLYGIIEEEVYVCQPLGFEDPDYPDKVYKMVKALYGLHQAPRAWYETLANYLLENGFQRKIDQTLFIKRQKDDILLVQIYVDDIIFGSTNKDLCKDFENLMKDKFQMSSIGELTFFLGLQVKQKKDEIFISQDKYVAEILRKFGLIDGQSSSTPIDTKKPLLKDADDSDYDGASLDRKFTTGGCQFLGCRLIYWQCKKQTIMATSSTEAEFVAATSCCAQVLWIQNQLLDYGFGLTMHVVLSVMESLKRMLYVLNILSAGSLTTPQMVNDVMRLQALVDKKKVIITEATIRDALHLHDAEGVECLPNKEIFTELARIGVGKERSEVETPLFEGMIVAQVDEGADEVNFKDVSTAGVAADGDDSAADDVVPTVVEEPFIPSPTPPTSPPQPLYDQPSTSQGRMIADIDADVDVTLKDVTDVAKDVQDAKIDEKPAELQEVVEVVTTAKLITEVVTAAALQLTTDAAQTLTTAPKEPKPLKKQAQIKQDEAYARELEAELNKNIDWDKVIDHVQRKEKEDNTIKRRLKKKKLDEEVAELKRHLQIGPNDEDDVYTEATPLARKVPVVDYEIYTENKKPYYKIIRVDGSPQLFLSFLSLLRNFDREDLEMLWELVKARFASSKPKNFSDDFLLTTFIYMFEKPEMILLVKRRYPLLRFTLDQLINTVRLEVEEESKCHRRYCPKPDIREQALKLEKWKNAMDVEIDALMRNETWDKSNQGWPLRQFDVKNAFLHEELKEEVYIYKQSNSDHTIFLRHRGDRVTCLIIYVDDMIITENDESEIKKLKEGLCAKFKMKDLGNLRYLSMLTGLETKEIKDKLLNISPWLEVIWSYGKVKSKKSSPYQVLMLNSESSNEKIKWSKKTKMVESNEKIKWKGSREREGNGYKLWYSGSSKARNGVGFIIAGRLKDDVVRVTRRSDMIMAILVVIDGEAVNVINAYAPGDLNCHIGAAANGYAEVHGGFGFGDRNEERRIILEFATAHEMVKNLKGEAIETFRANLFEKLSALEDIMSARNANQMWNTFANVIRDVAKDSLGVAKNVRYIKDEGGRTIVREEDIRNRWEEYFSSFFNESTPIKSRPKRNEEVGSSRQQMHYDCYYSRINQEEVKDALQRMGRNKSVGLDQIPIEAWRCLGEDPYTDNTGEHRVFPVEVGLHQDDIVLIAESTKGLNNKIKRVAIRPAMLYGSECWSIMKAQANRVQVAELRMLRWTYGKTMVDMIHNGVFKVELDVNSVIDEMKEERLRWFGHVRRRLQSALLGKWKLC
uniref:Uncharacterized mitochondrial protein AtMg00810-like n=1 Tax=Tanacetum cinerariifolium TaxID=118510 RepID=A0A6L2J193_TANCI|nr:uncharacterized mitochondrial protein AtMg00810-like [Tanacetum cinerariifolium]